MVIKKKRPVSPRKDSEERLFQSLRASNWDEFVGQEKARKALRLAIEASKSASLSCYPEISGVVPQDIPYVVAWN